MSQKINKPISDYTNAFYINIGKKIVLCVLSECLDQLAILRYINDWSPDDQTTVEYKTIEERCNTIKNEDILQTESKDSIDLLDFRRDCAFIESTIQKTYEEIRTKGSYEELSRLTNISVRLQKEEHDLLEDTKKKEEKYVQLQSMYLNERSDFRRKIDQMMMKIGTLKDEIEDFEQDSAIKNRYLKSWQNSKAEMNKYVLTRTETKVKEVISEKHHSFTKEDRVHQEIRNISNEIEMDLQKQLKKWKLKYEHDLEAITLKINNLQLKKEQQQEKTAEMERKYIQRQEEIDSYRQFKIEQEKKRLEKERRDKAATNIQAWWRGVIVRKGFGKFKKKKDKKGKKKSADKKK